jgi:allophanate hydrolase subunit 1
VKLKTWPNPAIDFTIVELPKSGNYLCQLYNMQGELIYEQTVSGKTWQVEFEGFQPGVYIATALSESGLKYSQKIVKNK